MKAGPVNSLLIFYLGAWLFTLPALASRFDQEHCMPLLMNGPQHLYAKKLTLFETTNKIITYFNKIGEFDLKMDKYIDAGKQGFAYKVKDQTSNKNFVLKVPWSEDPALLMENHTKQELEARILTKLKHDNIIQITAYTGGPYFGILMPFFEGAVIPVHQLEGAALEQFNSAISHMKSKGVSHNDLRGGNILINKSGEVRIIDFGDATYE